jgi:hypothetical protein
MNGAVGSSDLKQVTDFYDAIDNYGRPIRTAVLKATLRVLPGGGLEPSEEQEPIHAAPTYYGEPAVSSIVMEDDGAWFKPATDVVVVGSVVAPGGRPTRQCVVGVQVGGLRKDAIVFGERRWVASRMVGAVMSDPLPFERMPIAWERCYGGTLAITDEGRARHEPRNPIGTGLCDGNTLDGTPLPNFENPRELISSWRDRPAPHGFGFVGHGWMPRAGYAGTYGEAWRRDWMPLLPPDFDERFFNGAPPDMHLPGHLQGGELVGAVNLSERGVDRFVLPKVEVSFRVLSKRKQQVVGAKLDTLVLDLDASRVILVWRARYPVLLNEYDDEPRPILR